MTHFGFTLFAAAGLSLAMAAVEKRSARERARVATGVFVRCLAATVAGSWLMLAIHG
jgi:hypothetical protein